VGTFGTVIRRPTSIPVDACVGGRDLTEPRLAPDAMSIVVALSDENGASLVQIPIDGETWRTVAANPAPRVGRGFGGGCWCWSADGSAVVYAAVDGNLWWQPLPVAGAGHDLAPARRLTDHGPDHVAQAPHASPTGDRVVYVVDQSEVWSVAVHGGEPERLDDGSADFCFDPQVTPDGLAAVWLAWNVPNMPWDHARLVRVRLDGSVRDEHVPPASVQQPRFAPDGTLVCVRDDTGWNNVWWRDRPLVDEPFEHAGPTWGLGQRSFAVSPDGTHVAFTRNEAGFGRLCVVHVATGAVRELGRGVHGQLSWANGSLAALRSGARTPTEVVVYDVATGDRRTVVVGPLAEWDREALIEPETLTLTASDGETVHARLYRADALHRAPDEPPRMICWLHGGPTDQWQVTFMPRVAYWRAQGWDVLVPDHRGSTGHGRRYQQALRERWGELDVSDVADVVRHAHASGLATPARTVMIGGSAGGFTVLNVARHHPDLVAAAVVAYPVADLADLAERSHRFERHYTRTLVGEPPPAPEVDERARDRSPTWFADRIRTPLLVLHGEDDPVVPVGQSRVLVERIRAAVGGTVPDVELVVYPGEGHGFRQRVHQLDEYERIAAFLARHVATAPAQR
jgi:dipeptidyl aminopeptidase/acylaminoacyl peptidase